MATTPPSDPAADARSTAPRAPDGAEAPLDRPKPLPAVVRWHESWILRAAAIASFILFLGYSLSAFFTFQSIDSIAKLAYDEQIEEALAANLVSIKRVHELQQELLVERLAPLIASARANGTPLTPANLRTWIDDTHIIAPSELSQVVIAPYADGDAGAPPGAAPKKPTRGAGTKNVPAPSGPDTPILWLERDLLRVGPFTVAFPRGSAYESFKAAEDVRQRYQLIGAKLDENILPTLIRASATILVVSFVLLGSLFIVYAQRFKDRIGEVIAGFTTWSERDARFRFAAAGDRYQGELKLITRQFDTMADEVEDSRQRNLYLEKIASWQIIARKLAHEIKNPLTPIQMMVSQLKRRYKGEDEAFGKLLDEAQSIITEEVSGLRRMVDNFSNFARLPLPEPRPTDLVPLCRHALDLQKHAFAQHRFEFKSQGPQVMAVIDEDLIRQVLLNLVKNACEAAGEQPSDVSITLSEQARDVVLVVTDTGPGIPADLQSRIFEAYFTTKHTGPTPGMGLGLAVCQKIVLDHQGKMSVRSRPGETKFIIRLPRHAKAAS